MKSILSLSFLTLAVLVVGCGKGTLPDGSSREERTPNGERANKTSRNSDKSVITDISTIFNSTDRESLVGRRIDLDNVTVQSVPGDVIFLVGPTRGEILPVAVAGELRGQKDNKVGIHKHQRLHLRGDIQSLNAPENPKKFWNLIDKNERSEIMPQTIYISAETISEASSPLP